MKWNKLSISFFVAIFILTVCFSTISSSASAPIETNISKYYDYFTTFLKQSKLEKLISEREYEDYKITAYDLSYQSCQKWPSHPEYGITRTGFSLKKKNINKGDRFIAVDPDIIPLGSFVDIKFENTDEVEYSKYDGTYKAVDTGGRIKGNKIDLFIGGDKKSHKEALIFGITVAKAYVMTEEELELMDELED